MRNRGIGGVLVVLSIASSIAVVAQSGLLYLNEEPLSLALPVIQETSTILVPLEEFCPFIGLEVSDFEGEIVLRGAGFRQAFDDSLFLVEDGVTYVPLDWVLGLVDGELHWVGGDIYIQTRRPEIVAVEASTNQVTVRLTGFSPNTSERSQQALTETLLLLWPHSLLGIDARLIRVGESNIKEVRSAGASGGVELSVALEPGTTVATEQVETNDFYSLTIRVVETAYHESVIELGNGISVHEWSDTAEEHSIDYVYVESWRDRFRLAPTTSAHGYQATTSLSTILTENAAVAAISLDCSWDQELAECLIIDGLPYLVPNTPSEVLAIDLFGRWTTFSSLCSVGVKHTGQVIEVDGVNRRLAYGEVVTYAPGYTGGIARGIPGSFIAIKIRQNRVVSVYQGPFVPEDSSATLVVASGEAKAKLSLIELGDPIEVVCQFVHADGTYRHAISAGPQMIGDGTVTLNVDQLAELTGLQGGTVLACDWQGGLYMLTFTRLNHRDSEQDSWSLLDTLYSLPSSLKDAVLLAACGRNAIAYSSPFGAFLLGSQDPIRLALSLIPIAP